MAALAAELVVVLRDLDVQISFGRHLRSAENYLADALSRLSAGKKLPQQRVDAPKRANVDPDPRRVIPSFSLGKEPSLGRGGDTKPKRETCMSVSSVPASR